MFLRSLLNLVLLFLPLLIYAQQQDGVLTPRHLDSLQICRDFRKLHSVKSEGIEQNSRQEPDKWTPSPQVVQRMRSSSVLDDGTEPPCRDTARVFFLNHPSYHFYTAENILCKDGNILICGQADSNSGSYRSQGFLLKCDVKGQVLWCKLYDSTANNNYWFANFIQLIELNNGDVMLAGATMNAETGNYNMILMRTDASGNPIWNRNYSSIFWKPNSAGSSDNAFTIHQIEAEEANNSLYYTSSHWNDGASLTRFSLLNGNVQWSRAYNLSYSIFNRPMGFRVLPNEIHFFSRSLDNYTGRSYMMAYRINKSSGDTISTRFFLVNDQAGKPALLSCGPLHVLDNGNYVFAGSQYGYFVYPPTGNDIFYLGGVMQFNSNLDFVKAYSFKSKIAPNINLHYITFNGDGSGMFYFIENEAPTVSNMRYVQFKNEMILNQRKRPLIRPDYISLPAATTLRLPNGTDMLISLHGIEDTNQSKIEFANFAVTDTSSLCVGEQTTGIFTETFQVENYQNIPFRSISDNVFYLERQQTLTVQDINMQYAFGCTQNSYCTSLELLASADTVCSNTPLIITARKNQECGGSVQLNMDLSAVSSFKQLTDSTFSIEFNNNWEGEIYANTGGCQVLNSKIKVVALAELPKPDLGPDTVLCPGNSITLRVPEEYSSYLWNDGSTNSSYTITAPGKYYVTTTSLPVCHETFSDTIMVLPHPPIPFSLGSDKELCAGDTIQLYPPTGFINYVWNNYRSIPKTDFSLQVYPDIDTAYYLKAQNKNGCNVSDTINIKVNTVPDINLGSDTSFCENSAVLLDAGTDYVNYRWNTGVQGPVLLADKAGTYIVTATHANGCKSGDTLTVLNVYRLPRIDFGADRPLCKGDSIVLDAGDYKQYNWDDGSVERLHTIKQTGIYSVIVTDVHGCSGSGGITINKIVMPPSGFLSQSDTTICSYAKLNLQPSGNFKSYLWSNNSSAPSITVSSPGLYWLQVKDQYGCTGRDSVDIQVKDCLLGLYMPNTFTPNNDGINDMIRPRLFGETEEYEFIIYNRWGRIVFKSNDPAVGWNGRINDQPQDTGTFVWTCRYKLKDRQRQLDRGKILLLR